MVTSDPIPAQILQFKSLQDHFEVYYNIAILDTETTSLDIILLPLFLTSNS